MTTVVYEISDPATLDGLTIERDGSRLLVRSVVDGRERCTILAHGVAEGRRLAAALLDALDPEGGRVPQEVL